jgi:acetolactate synthase-1/2/3 large subunit
LRADALDVAGRIAAATGARLVCETFPARLQRGAGRVAIDKLPYFGEIAAEFLAPFSTIVICGTEPPVAFFAYPDKPSALSPPAANVLQLAGMREDALAALTALAAMLNAPAEPAAVQARAVPAAGARLDAHAIGAVLAELMPAGAIVSDEAVTASADLFEATRGAAPHDWLMVTGGAIGQGLPVATGAAVACPDRQVIALQADGSAMYTLQALWTMARERLKVVTVVFNNASYAILNIELSRVGVQNPGPRALSMLSLDHPRLDWCALAAGMGVPAQRVDSVAGFRTALEQALATRGPMMIEAMV